MEALAKTMEPLTKLYASVGLTEDETKECVQGINERLHELINEELQVEQARFDRMRNELPEMEAELETLREVLGGDGVGAKPSSDKAVLVPYHRSLTATVEAARATRGERLEQRNDKETKISSVRLELDGDAADVRSSSSPSEPEAGSAGGLTLALLGRLQARLDSVNDERKERVANVEAVRTKCSELRRMLGYTNEEAAAGEQGTNGSSAISTSALAALQHGLAELEAERTRRTAVLSDVAGYISELQSKLELPEAEWVRLPEPDKDGLTLDVMGAYHAELERLDAIKGARLGPLLEAARARLRPLWEELYMSEEETRSVCAAAWPSEGASETSEDVEDQEILLEAVEEEERRLKAKLESSVLGKSLADVLGLMAKREGILSERAEMLAAKDDPSRLTSRRDPGRLLREEKLRNKVEKDLPKMNKRLRELAAEWSSANGGEVLTFKGKPIAASIDEQETEDVRVKEAEKARKEAEKEQAKQAANGANNKPIPRTSAAATKPGAAKAAVAASARHGAPPSKPGAAKPAPNGYSAASKKEAHLAAAPPPPPPLPERVPGEAHAAPERVLQAVRVSGGAAASPGNAPAGSAKGATRIEKENGSALEIS